MFKKALTTVTFAAVAATAMFAASAQAANNPLHPSYFQEKAAKSVQSNTTAGTAHYVDVRNPLSPSFSRSGDANWMVTSNTNVVAYVDSRNPLSPRFKR